MTTARSCLAVLGLTLLLAGCVRPEQVAATPEGIWIKKPVISVGDPETLASEHCARFGKTAVPAASLTGNTGDWRQPVERSSHLPILAYDCK